MEFLEQNKLLSAFQLGFGPRLSTELAAMLLLYGKRTNVDQGKLIGTAFTDLRKAFDTKSHSNLLEKLPLYAVHGDELDWSANFLFGRSVVYC